MVPVELQLKLCLGRVLGWVVTIVFNSNLSKRTHIL